MPNYRNARAQLRHAQEIWDAADAEGRPLTKDERQRVQAIHDSTRPGHGT